MINDRNSPTFCHFSFLQREAESLLAVSFNNIRCCALSIPIGRCTSAVIDEPVLYQAPNRHNNYRSYTFHYDDHAIPVWPFFLPYYYYYLIYSLSESELVSLFYIHYYYFTWTWIQMHVNGEGFSYWSKEFIDDFHMRDYFLASKHSYENVPN